MRILSTLLIPALALLASCGFHPVYGTGGTGDPAVAAEMQQVAIDNIADRPGQILRNSLIDRMYGKGGRPSHPAYHLSVKLRAVEEDLGILSDATSTFAEFSTYADYILTDDKGKQILAGTAHGATSYDRLDNQYATLAAHDSAVDRTAREVGEQIVNRLSLYFAERNEKTPETSGK